MSNVLRLAIVDPNDSNRESLKSMFLSMDIVWLEAECSRYEFFTDVVAQTEPDIGVVVVDQDPEKALELIRQLGTSSPNCSVLVASSSTDGELILAAMRAGAKEFLTLPLKVDDLITALERISTQRSGGIAGKSRSCTVVAIAGASGGVGTTSVAVNLGCALAGNEENSVVLVDLDLAVGDADVLLDTIPDYTVSDISQNVARLDFTLLKRSLTKHACGLYLLPRPVQLHEMSLINSEDLNRVIGLLKASFSHLIIDISKGYNELDMVALREATHVLLVTQLDLPCLRNVVRLMMSFGETEGLKEKIRVIVNRVGGRESGQISLKKAQETIDSEIFWQIPNDYRVMIEVRNNGRLLFDQAPKAPITQHMLGLAAAIDGDTEVIRGAGKGGLGKWLSFWPNKPKSNETAEAPASKS